MTATDNDLAQLAQQLGASLSAAGQRVVTAESCTGGWIAKAMTDIPGSSAWFECGFVTYSNAAKQAMLGVEGAVLERFGAVSEEAVCGMVKGALERTAADLAVAVTGIAGPQGGSEDKPVGLVWFCWQRRGDEPGVRAVHFDGNRDQIRRQAVQAALWGLIGMVSPHIAPAGLGPGHTSLKTK